MSEIQFFTPEDLLKAAELGKKLKPKERRLVILWLERSGEIDRFSDAQLAQLFKCKPSSIATYRSLARQTLAQAITAEEAMNYMAEFMRHYDLLIKEAKIGIHDSERGSIAHQQYMRLLKDVASEKIDKLQSIGVIPKELGRLTHMKEEWVAEVSDEGVASVRLNETPED